MGLEINKIFAQRMLSFTYSYYMNPLTFLPYCPNIYIVYFKKT